MKLRRVGVCCICQSALEAGTSAEWSAERRTVTCQPCVAEPTRAANAPTAPGSQLRPLSEPSDLGVDKPQRTGHDHIGERAEVERVREIP